MADMTNQTKTDKKRYWYVTMYTLSEPTEIRFVGQNFQSLKIQLYIAKRRDTEECILRKGFFLLTALNNLESLK